MAFIQLTLFLSALGSPAGLDTAPVCRAVSVSKQPGDLVEEHDTRIVPCIAGSKLGHLHFDVRRNVVIAAEPLVAGDMLGLVYFPRRPAVSSGDRIQISARIGHVTITREATALQSARAGQHFFARADDGAIFLAPRAAQEVSR